MPVTISEMEKNVLYKNVNDNSLWRRNNELERFEQGKWVKIKITKQMIEQVELEKYKTR